jgi:hypothetical protein
MQKLNGIVQQAHTWTLSNTCASFASETFYAVTGIDVDADEYFGAETPREVGEHIKEANSGSAHPTGDAVRIPDDLRGALPLKPQLLWGQGKGSTAEAVKTPPKTGKGAVCKKGGGGPSGSYRTEAGE